VVELGGNNAAHYPNICIAVTDLSSMLKVLSVLSCRIIYPVQNLVACLNVLMLISCRYIAFTVPSGMMTCRQYPLVVPA